MIFFNLINIIPKETIERYNLHKLEHKGHIYLRINKGMYGLPQEWKLTNVLLQERMNPCSYAPVRRTPGLWKRTICPVLVHSSCQWLWCQIHQRKTLQIPCRHLWETLNTYSGPKKRVLPLHDSVLRLQQENRGYIHTMLHPNSIQSIWPHDTKRTLSCTIAIHATKLWRRGTN